MPRTPGHVAVPPRRGGLLPPGPSDRASAPHRGQRHERRDSARRSARLYGVIAGAAGLGPRRNSCERWPSSKVALARSARKSIAECLLRTVPPLCETLCRSLPLVKKFGPSLPSERVTLGLLGNAGAQTLALPVPKSTTCAIENIDNLIQFQQDDRKS